MITTTTTTTNTKIVDLKNRKKIPNTRIYWNQTNKIKRQQSSFFGRNFFFALSISFYSIPSFLFLFFFIIIMSNSLNSCRRRHHHHHLLSMLPGSVCSVHHDDDDDDDRIDAMFIFSKYTNLSILYHYVGCLWVNTIFTLCKCLHCIDKFGTWCGQSSSIYLIYNLLVENFW